MMKSTLHFIKRHLSILLALTIFMLLILASLRYSTYRKGVWEKDVRANLQEILIGKKSALEKALYSRIYYTRGVAAYVSMHPKIGKEEYALLAHEFIQNDSVIGTMALSKDGIITYISPEKGHETAIGLDLLEHPERRQIVEKTIKTHKTFIAGPVELVEGGVAFISYTPIFNQTSNGENDFWGVTDIVIQKDKLLKEAGLSVADDLYTYALKGYNGKGNDGAVFFGNEDIFNTNPVTINIDLPTGNWILASIPHRGWEEYFDQDKTLFFTLLISSLIISILLWLIIKATLKIRRNEKELTAIFRSMNSLVIELNKKGEYIKIAPSNKSLLYKPEEQLIGKSVYDVFDMHIAKQLHDSISECLNKKKVITTTYPLEINGKTQWFSAQISNKTADTVIFNAHDITELKRQEERILKTSEELAELNETKDRFFSIIAHDLRGPMSSYKALTDILVKNYDEIGEADRMEMIKSMQNSSSDIIDLLENLLSWSQSQSKNLSITKQACNLKEIIDSVLPAFASSAELKQVKIQNNIPSDMMVKIDIDATKVILRNLISNAIKFSHEKGKVSITSKQSGNYVTISVKDSGVGIPEKRIDNLFAINKSKTTKGTHGEKGTGLGLILCKEFAEKQGGSIQVESNSKGTCICISIPA